MPTEDSSSLDKLMSELEAGVEGKYLTGDNMTIAGRRGLNIDAYQLLQ